MSVVKTYNMPAHCLFEDNGELRGHIKERFEKNHMEDIQQAEEYKKMIIKQEQEKKKEVPATSKFGQNKGLIIASAGGLLLGGLFGAVGAAGVWGINMLITKRNTKKEEKEEKEDTETEITL